DCDPGGDDAHAAAHLLGRDPRVESEHLDRARVGREQRADDPQRGRLTRPVGPEEAEDLAAAGLQRDSAQHLVRPERLLEPVDPDRRFVHLFLEVRLVAVDRGLGGVLGLVPALGLAAAFAAPFAGARLTVARLAGARFASGFCSPAASVSTSAVAGSSADAGSIEATPTELDSVR